MSDDVVQRIVDAAGSGVLRLGQALGSDAKIQAIAQRLGWKLDAIPPSLPALGASLRAIGPALDAARRDPSSPTSWAALIEAVAGGASAIDALAQVDFGATLGALGFASTFPIQLVHWAAIEHLSRAYPRILGVLRAVGFVVARTVDPGPGRAPYRDERFALPDFGAVFSSPSTLLRAAWAWAAPEFDDAAFLGQIATAFRRFGVASGFQLQPASPRELGGSAIGSRWHLITRLLAGSTTAGAYELGLRWLVFEQDALPALAIIPYVDGTLADTIALGSLQLAITGMATSGEQTALVIAPTSIALVDDFRGAGTARPEAQLALALKPATATPAQLTVGDAGNVTTAGWQLQIKATATAGTSDIALELSFPGASIGLATGGSGLLGAAGVGDRTGLAMPFAIGVSARRGLYVGAADGSPLVLGTIALGPVQLRDATLAVTGVDAGFAAAVTCNVTVAVGPLSVSLAGVGATLTARFPGRGGNLGPVDLEASAVPPTGGALALDTVVAKGGGAITHVAGRDYRCALVFDVLGVHVAAIGVLDDSPANHGAFVAIAGTSFPGIQLGWGFTLDGIGGAIATHRTLDTDQIRANLARGSASTLLDFDLAHGDILARVDALACAFPPAVGRYVVGPTFRIGWGTPRIVQADLALLLELPSPVRLVLLGAVQAGLPTLAQRVVDLRVDVLGVVDFARDTLAIDASLHDSKLAGYALTGDLALRLGWGDQPEFLLAIGGFHPHFTPPPGFPQLRRLALTAGDNPQLRLQAYLALTSNTAQVGAQADLGFHGGGFEISAHVGFDALFVFVPFQFEIDIDASAAITWHGHHLASVALDFTLTGPHPWHAVGDASFGILWWDVSVGFDVTWGDATPAALPPPPDVAATLRAALADPSAWSSELPDGEPGWLVLAPAAPAKLHPLGTAIVHQRVVPLGLDIDQFGTIPLATTQHFTIATVSLGGTTATFAEVDDTFAPGQFVQMTTDERLAAPSFERLASGASIGAGVVAAGATAAASLEADTIVVDPLAPPPPPPRFVIGATFANLLHAVAAAPPAPAPSGPRLRELAYVVASTSDLSTSGAATTFANALAARKPGQQVIAAAHAA